MLATVRRDRWTRPAGRTRGVQGADPGAVRDPGPPYYATARLWDDGVIDPADTRSVLAWPCRSPRNAPLAEPRFGMFRM